jgi:uncharacterized membrane protein YkoI
MKKKIAVAGICLASLLFAAAASAQEAAVKPGIVGFAAMAAGIENSYGTLLELDLTVRGGEPVYKAEIIIAGGKITVVYFNAATGTEIARKDAVPLDEDEAKIYYGYIIAPAANQAAEQAAPANGRWGGAKISYERAREIALARVGGGVVREIDLDYERGRLVYDVEVRHNYREYEIKVDAATGEIVRYKIDD